MAFPLASLIGPALRYLGNAFSFIKSKLERHYWVYYILKKAGLESKKDDFANLYVASIYSLINEKNKRRSIIRLFEIPEVRKAFETELYEKNNWTFRLTFDDHLHTNPTVRNLKIIQVDIDKELSDFRDVFVRLINESRLPKEVESHQAISSMMEKMDSLQAGVESIKQKLGGLEIGDSVKFGKSEVVPLVQHLSKRDSAVTNIFTIFEKKDAVFMTGSVSTGKTQLSVLAFERHTGKKSWISLKETTSQNFFEKIKQALVGLNYNEGVSSSLEPSHLIVLDDLPKVDENGSYIGQLVNFFKNCGRTSMKVLVTSH